MEIDFTLIMYGLIGITGALSAILFFAGFVMYLARLGTFRRKSGISIMEWGVRLIITSIVLMGILRFWGWWNS